MPGIARGYIIAAVLVANTMNSFLRFWRLAVVQEGSCIVRM